MNPFNENKAVGQLSELLALERGYSSEKARQIRTAAALHDIGKQKLPQSILNKPSRLTVQEFEIVKKHTKIGAAMLSSIQGNIGVVVRNICLLHHEWQNGKGYWGISDCYLPEYVLIVAIADVYTALIDDTRPYKQAWTQNDALAYIQGQAGTQFTAVLVEMFIYLILHDSRVPAIFTDN